MKRFVLALALLSNISSQAEKEGKTIPIECGLNSFRCGDNSKCVQGKNLCDFQKDCDDFSDEQFSLCKIFHEKRGECSTPGSLNQPDYGCRDIFTICYGKNGYFDENPDLVKNSRYYDEFRPLCNQIKNGLQPNEEFNATRHEMSTLRKELSALQEESTLKDIFSHLATSFNQSSFSKNESDCPPLYVNISEKCVALFTIAKVTWAEARHFCESISGSLAIIRELQDYEALLKHLKYRALATDFWIGGYYSKSMTSRTLSWMWMDDKDITMGAPYWSLYQTQNCTMRKTSPGCYKYSLAPRKNREGFCLSMDFAFHYYFTDQNCHEKRSPLCILNEN